MPSYAGVNLTQPFKGLSEAVAKYIPLSDVVPMAPMPALVRLNSILPYGDQCGRPIKLGSLWWPQGASRWATGFFIATEPQVKEIRNQVYSGAGYSAQSLVMNDGTTTITANMFMLPPRPLFQMPPDDASYNKWLIPKTFVSDEPIYLLPLVDQRYFWWQRVSTVAITDTSTTWSGLFSTIGTNLGVTITPDSISGSYLTVPLGFSAYQSYLPLLLDLAAFAIGHRVIRKLDGTVITQKATTALTSVAASLVANHGSRMAGGQFALDVA